MNLFNFELRTSSDIVKNDLELTCIGCRAVLCDAEAGDSLYSLVAMCEDHAKSTGHGL